MFMARCVLNMYLFGTFSEQNAPEIALTVAAFVGSGGVHRAGYFPSFAHRARLP